MIKKFLNRILGKDAQAGRPAVDTRFGKRREVGPAEHGIDASLVDERAVRVVRDLKAAGYEAYIVGGAVRDLLLGLRPKDFDVATNATPEQVKACSRRAFIIGRRFRIVHVVFGRGRQDRGLSEVIEVTTFRAFLDNTAAEQVSGNEKTSKAALANMQHAVDASGRVLRDNVWGSQQEDAARRDFTINAMYYDPETQVVVDYHGGIEDARKRLIRMIGDPATRYREDPVRIIRAIRFAAKLAKLGFTFERKTLEPLPAMKALLADVPQSRLFDEMLKLLQTGHALASVEQLQNLGMARGIYPLLDVVVERAAQPFVQAALADTDRRVGEGKPVAPSFLLACVLWADVRDGWARRQAQRQPSFPALQDAIDDAFDSRIGDVSGRGKLGTDMREIWLMQPRFDRRTGNAPFSLVQQPRFRAGFDFLRLRGHTGEIPAELANWWEEFSLASDDRREDMIQGVRQSQQQPAKNAAKPRRAKGPSKTYTVAPGATSATQGALVPAEQDLDAEAGAWDDDGVDDGPLIGKDAAFGITEGDAAAPKKRRRRRKPAAKRVSEGGEPSQSPAPAPAAPSHEGV
ncbi:poly(A) polymerase [Comamonas sp. BIGb0124]|uniref:polynucleotide adenylyltransferase PcnB n=1 Tax=Comamonas sp. BIGb0124 TaxID=2485130 RepID=UPI000F466CB2|nr:polynucleotide adenylyltransferase PcnB [Comamonas sp. BIGb0124]ROR20419.1 poly(A) polymerase [Comamonas sp. BIGb0124]